MNGAFVTFEGGEGVGKSTQAALLVERLRGLGVTVVALREPGGTAAGDRVREVLLDPASAGLSARAELFLYEACRAELVDKVIRPSLEEGMVVVCDRFTDSTLAYQGFGRSLDAELGTGRVRELNDLATGGLHPDLTVLLEMDHAEALGRAIAESADRLEREAVAFHERVLEGFRAIAAEEPDRVMRVDAAGSPEGVASAVWRVAEPALIRLGVLG